MEILQQIQHIAEQSTKNTAHVRAMIYHALAEALAEPTSGIEGTLVEAATTGARVLGSTACRQAALTLTELPAPGIETLRRSYTRLMTTPDRRPVALYESLHRQGCLMGQATQEVERYYQTLGLIPIDGELPDHASVELALLGHLAAAEAEAQTAGDSRLASRLRAEQRFFLRTHVGVWLPEVGLALAAAGDPFYAVVGRLLNEFLAEELVGRKPKKQKSSTRLPALKDPSACTLCGLCVGSCPLGALRVVESATETALTLNQSQCTGCNRCVNTCPERVLFLSPPISWGSFCDTTSGYQTMRYSSRAGCPNCGRPTVSQAELDAVFARLQPDPVMQRRLSLCVECKSWST